MIAGPWDEVGVARLNEGDRTAIPQNLGGQMGHLLEDHVEFQSRVEELGGTIQEGRLAFLTCRLIVQESVFEGDPNLVKEAALVGVEAPRGACEQGQGADHLPVQLQGDHHKRLIAFPSQAAIGLRRMLREVLHHDRCPLLQDQPRQAFPYFAAVGVLGHLWRHPPVCDQHQLTGLLFQQIQTGLRCGDDRLASVIRVWGALDPACVLERGEDLGHGRRLHAFDGGHLAG